jgi:hypothetical protein
MTRSVYCRAMATVSSLLAESTTRISSAQATDRNASAMSAASFRVMTVTESFGTRGVYQKGAEQPVVKVGRRIEAGEAGGIVSRMQPDFHHGLPGPDDRGAAGGDGTGLHESHRPRTGRKAVVTPAM